MDYQELIERMRAFNDWRRGGDFEMPHPMQIGMDIDAMCDAIESLLAENDRLNHNLTSTEQTMREYQELAAKEAGIEFKPLPRDLYCEAWLEQLEHLASIIEKRTIERCAVVCDNVEIAKERFAGLVLDDGLQTKLDCVAAIRKLGE